MKYFYSLHVKLVVLHITIPDFIAFIPIHSDKPSKTDFQVRLKVKIYIYQSSFLSTVCYGRSFNLFAKTLSYG